MNPIHTIIPFLYVSILNLIPASVTEFPKYVVLSRLSRWDIYRFLYLSFMLHILFALTEGPDRLWGLLSVLFAGYRRLFPRVNRLEREADQSRLSSFEVKMSGTIPTLSHTHSWPAKRRLLCRYECSNWGSTMYEVLTAVTMKITAVRDVICDVVDTSCQRFGRACCLYLCRGYATPKRCHHQPYYSYWHRRLSSLCTAWSNERFCLGLLILRVSST